MKTQALLLAIFTLFIMGFSSCKKNEIENPTFQVKFKTVTSSASFKIASADSIEFTSGHIILENIEFNAESDTDSLEVSFEIDAFITIDFATGVMTPDLSAIEIVPGDYTEIELEFELWDQTGQPSIDLYGTWTDVNGTKHPIRLMMPLGQTFSLEIDGEFTVHTNTAMIAYITIDPSSWFLGEAGDLLYSATTNSGGVIVISPDQNSNIYDLVKDAIDHTSEIEIEID